MGNNVCFGVPNTSKSDENTLAIWERKIMGKVFGLVKLNGLWATRSNEELTDVLYKEPDIISEIRKGRLQWLGRVERMPEERTIKEVIKNIPQGKGLLESHETDGWIMLKNDLKKMSVGGCTRIARDRDTCKLILTEARVLYGP